MSLLANAGPGLPITHQPVPHEQLFALKDALIAATAGAPVTMEIIERVAAQHEVGTAVVYASMAFDPQLMFDASAPALLAVCVGTCQYQGAMENLQELLALRAERLAAGKGHFDILPRTCLDMCAHSPVCLTRNAKGEQKVHPRLKPNALRQVVDDLCED